MKYNRTELDGNIGFTSVIDEKFKTACLAVRFITELSEDKVSSNLMGIDTITYSNSKIKTFSELNEKLFFMVHRSLLFRQKEEMCKFSE